MTEKLNNNKPIFLKFLKKESLSQQEQNALNDILQQYKGELDIPAPNDEDTLAYIYVDYCKHLISEIDDAESAEYAYDFAQELFEACKDQHIAALFDTEADAALDLLHEYLIEKLYETLIDFHENDKHDEISRYEEYLSTNLQKNPNDAFIRAKHQLLKLLVTKWKYSQSIDSVTINEHINIMFKINEYFSVLVKYTGINRLKEELGYLWSEWFIDEYVTKLVIERMDILYKTTSATDIQVIKALSPEQQSEFSVLIQGILLGYTKTCLASSCNPCKETNTNDPKRKKMSLNYFSRNIGNLTLIEFNIELIVLLLKDTKESHRLWLESLELHLREFVPYATKEWIISCHRVLTNFASLPAPDSETKNLTLGKYITMIQFLEHCYYNRTDGKSIPTPKRSTSIITETTQKEPITPTESRPKLKLKH
jgi:hypothetical protein